MPIYPAFPEVDHGAWMWHDESTVLSGNAFLHSLDTLELYRTYTIQNPPAINDSFTNSFFVKAGTYTLYTLGLTASNNSIRSWYIDNVLVGTTDGYSAGNVYNVIQSVSGIVLTDGRHTLKCISATKNASSSAYFAHLTAMWLKQASD